MRWNAHVQEPGHRPGGVCGVNGGQDQVARDGRAHGDLRCLPVTNLTHHHDVRVLAQDRSQGGRKGQARQRVDLDLIDPVQSVFHGVLEGHDVESLLVQLGERGEQAAALSTSRGPRGQDHTLTCGSEAPHEVEVPVGEP